MKTGQMIRLSEAPKTLVLKHAEQVLTTNR
jgi:hypothetical protein